LKVLNSGNATREGAVKQAIGLAGGAMRRLGPLLLMSALPACSFALIKGRPSPPVDPNSRLECTASRAAPAVDVALAVLSAGGGALALATAPPSTCTDYSCVGADSVKGLGVAGLVVGAVYAASAVYGFVKTSGCRDALAAQRACLTGDTAICASSMQAPDNRTPP
jgi:hypothetical protein